MCVFFFQAEDGIRDKLVTGVQTCALPIWAHDRRGDELRDVRAAEPAASDPEQKVSRGRHRTWPFLDAEALAPEDGRSHAARPRQLAMPPRRVAVQQRSAMRSFCAAGTVTR